MPADELSWRERVSRLTDRVVARWDAAVADVADVVGWDDARDAQPQRGPGTDPRDARIAARGVDAVIGDCGLYENGARRSGRIPLATAVRQSRSTHGFVWVGLQEPSEDDVATVAAAFDLPALAVEDAVKAHQRPKLEVYEDVVFAVLKPVRYVDHDEVVDVAELAVFIGPHFVVTVRHGESDVLRRVRAELDASPAPSSLGAGTRTGSAGSPDGRQLSRFGPAAVLYRAADLAVDGYEEALKAIDADVDHIESRVFDGTDHEDHSERIYKLKREIAEFRRAVQPLAGPLQQLADGHVPCVSNELVPYFRDVHDHVLRAADAIEGHDRLLSDVLQADLARVAAEQSRIAVRQNEIAVRQNEDMRKISAWAAIGLVPTAIAGIYGMNFDNIPELHWKYGYFAALAVIGVVCVGLHRLFHRNGWL